MEKSDCDLQTGPIFVILFSDDTFFAKVFDHTAVAFYIKNLRNSVPFEIEGMVGMTAP